MDLNISVDSFFSELLVETDKQYTKSPIYQKQLSHSKRWYYAICATPISKGKGILFGINWGGSDNFHPQTVMPSGQEVTEYHFIKQSRQFLEKQWGLDFKSINFNYTNFCFFRTPKAEYLSLDDYLLSLPLFEKYVHYINPPWLLSIGGINIKMLNTFGLLKNIQLHFDNENKFRGYSAQLWVYDIFSVPHPNAHLTTEARHTIWIKITNEMKKATNRS